MVCSAAERILNRESIMPQYQEVLTGHGDCSPLGSIFGHDPVEVKTPASSAAYKICQFPSTLLTFETTTGPHKVPEHHDDTFGTEATRHVIFVQTYDRNFKAGVICSKLTTTPTKLNSFSLLFFQFSVSRSLSAGSSVFSRSSIGSLIDEFGV